MRQRECTHSGKRPFKKIGGALFLNGEVYGAGYDGALMGAAAIAMRGLQRAASGADS